MINVIPTPKIYNVNSEITVTVECAIYTDNNNWAGYCDKFAEDFYRIWRIKPEFKQGGIELVYDKMLDDSKYVITCSNDRIFAAASTDEGILYALATLLQVMGVDGNKFVCQEMDIEDYPDKEYRGMMVDLAREWHPFDKLFKYIDVCFMYKVKYLHLHFADSGLYTLPSKAFPKLCVENRYYTSEQIKKLNEYAKLRGVVIVPEFECPGHAPVLTKNYPQIFKDKFEEEVGAVYYNELGLQIDVEELLCAGSEKCFEGVKTLIKEVCDMFPDSPYINIGGDEPSIKLWAKCSECKKYMADNNIDDEFELYSDYIGRISRYVLSLGKTPMVWEGFPRKGAERIPKETIVIAWEAFFNLPQDIIADGFRAVNSSWQPLYVINNPNLRYNANHIMEWNIHSWRHWSKMSKAHLNPITIQPTEQLIGSLFCSWQQTYEQEINFIMEYLAAVSERTWGIERVCPDDEFRTKHLDIYNKVARLIQDL